MTTKTAPFFVGGPLHSKGVPGFLCDQQAIEAVLQSERVIYIRTVWWRPQGGSITVFVRDEMPIPEMVVMVDYMLRMAKR